jgi:hypothetical protein
VLFEDTRASDVELTISRALETGEERHYVHAASFRRQLQAATLSAGARSPSDFRVRGPGGAFPIRPDAHGFASMENMISRESRETGVVRMKGEKNC